MGEVGGSSSSGHYDRGPETGFPHFSDSDHHSSSACSYKRSSSLEHAPIHSRLAGEGFRSGSFCTGGLKNPDVLLSDVHRLQEGRKKTTSSRSIVSKQVVKNSQVQDGNPRPNCEGYSGGPLGGVFGHLGRLSECSTGPPVPQVLRVRSGGKNIRIPSSSIRTVDSSVGLFKGDKAHKSSPASSGDDNLLIFRRFLNSSRLAATNQVSYHPYQEVARGSRVQDQSGQVIFHASPASGVSGGSFGLGKPYPISSRGKDTEDPSLGGGRKGESFILKERSREPSGFSELHCGLPSSGKALFDTYNCVDELSHSSGVQRLTGTSGQGIEKCSASLDIQGFSKGTSSNAFGNSLRRHHDGCVRLRMGRGLDPVPGARDMVPFGEQPIHELEGTKGHIPDVGLLLRPSSGEDSQGVVRQYNSLGLSSSPGVPSLSSFMEPHQGDSGIVQGEKHLSNPGSSERSPQCLSRQSLQGHSNLHGVVSGSPDICLDLPTVGLSSDRPFCHKVQSSATSVYFPISRPNSCGLGRSKSGLEQVPVSIRLSSSSAAAGSGQETGNVPGFRVSDSPFLANGGLVSSPISEVSEEISAEAGSLAPPEDPGRPPVPLAGFRFKPSRLDTIAASLYLQGFYENTVALMMKQHKQTSVRQYQTAWTKFLGFLDQESIAHDKVVLSTVFNFLSDQLDKYDWAYSTIAGYRCALIHPLFYALNLVLDVKQSDSFMKGLFASKPPPRTTKFPLWSLSDVLYFLIKGPFEPLEEASWPLLTQKVFFLLLLSSGRRISELANLSRDFVFRQDSVILKWLPDFRAKHDTVDFQPEDPSISRLNSLNDIDLKLCPVRAWEIYLRRRNNVDNVSREDCFWLVSKPTLSDYFVSLVKRSRKFSERSDIVNICVHQMRKFAVSYSKKYFSISDKDLYTKMGSSSMSVLKSNYIRDVNPLRFICVVPAGTLKPG